MKLLKYIKDYRFPAIGGFVSKIAEAALELLVPLVMADIIDVGIANNDQNYILSRGLILVALAVIVGVLAFVAGVCYEIGSFWTWQALRYLWGV